MYPAGRSSPKTYQTRRAWASFVRATEVTRHGTATWTWLHAPRDKTALEFRRNRMRILLPSTGGAETAESATERRGVPATVRRADARRLIDECPAPQETRDFFIYRFRYIYIIINVAALVRLVAFVPVLNPL